MKYSDICNAFYISEEESKQNIVEFGLTSVTSQGAIAERIISLGWSRESLDELEQYNISTFNKWFYGTTGQKRAIWKLFEKEYDEEKYVGLLEAEFNEDVLPKVAEKLGITISNGKSVNRHMLALAIGGQMCEFAKSRKAKQEADSILNDVYSAGKIEVGFSRYIEKAIERYNVMKLLGGDEVPLEKFFVCNTIGESERVFADKKKIKSVYIEDPTMQSIRDAYKKRGFDNIRTVLIGSGGCGKSLMLQHLFLQAAEEYSDTGILPVFLELRHFTASDDILSYLVKTVSALDETFNVEAAKNLLLTGKCQILFDGFDEIDPSDVNVFLGKLTNFVTKYDKTQIIITSRQNESLVGLRQFPKKLYVWPFEKEQSEKLIDKILEYKGNPGAKDAVLNYINNGFLKKDGVFVSHPLLLTFVTTKFASFNRFNEDPSLFYKVTYEALLSGHDENKKPYDRVFMSVDDSNQFSKVFMEFCALTYKDGVLELDTRTFEEYFNRLKSHKGFPNPAKMNVKNFKHDVCSTACIMYEKEYDIFYIDPGFQECLFAEYYYQAGPDEMGQLVKSLSKMPFSKFSKFEAFDMLYKLSSEKFKFKILIPFLELIFSEKDDIDRFRKFLEVCFNEIKIVDIDEEAKLLCMKKTNADTTYVPEVENYSCTVLLNYILKNMGEDPEFSFPLYSKTRKFDGIERRSVNLPEELEPTGMVIVQEVIKDDKKFLLLDCKPMDAYKYFRTEHLNGNQNVYLTDESKELVCVGSRLTIESYYLMSEPEQYKELVEDIANNSDVTYTLYRRIKAYFRRLQIEHHNSGLN